MASISSPGIASKDLDVKSIVAQLVELEKKPLDMLKLQAAAVNTKISTYGQLKSLVAALADAAQALGSDAGWNGVSAQSSDAQAVSATAVGGSLPGSFVVEVQSLAKAQTSVSAALPPAGGALGAGKLRIELGQWSDAERSFRPGSGQAVELSIGADDKLADIVRKINAAEAGVSASVLSDASGERLLLRGKNTGQEADFRLSVLEGADADARSAGNTDATGLSRLVAGSRMTQAAANARATVNGVAVSSASNTFANTVSGVTFKAEQVTRGPVEITVSRDDKALRAQIDAFVKAYNAVNQSLQEATKYDAKTRTAGLLQGDATALALQSTLRRALTTVSSSGGAYQRLADVGLGQALGGDLALDSAKLDKALADKPQDVQKLFRHQGDDGAKGTEGIALRLKKLSSELLSDKGLFRSKDDSLQLSLKRNSQQQTRVNDQAAAFEKRITQRYNALDKQLSSLNALNAYVTQQLKVWNKARD